MTEVRKSDIELDLGYVHLEQKEVKEEACFYQIAKEPLVCESQLKVYDEYKKLSKKYKIFGLY